MSRVVAGKLRPRFWVTSGLAVVTAVVALLTLFVPDWIEAVFRWDPDGRSGALEWSVVAAGLLLSSLFSLVARAERRRALLAAA